MKRGRRFIPVFLTGAVVALMLYTGVARAATCEKWAGKVVSVQGVVEAKTAGQALWEPAKLNETYCPGDTIRTDRRSRADIALYNHPVLRLDQNSTVTLGGMKDEKTSLVDMLSGAALFFSRVTRNLEVRTATVNAGVEGTEFFIRAEEGKTDLAVFEGKVLAINEAGSLAVTTGQSAVAEKGKAPVPVVVVRPRDAVRWALYYPPIVHAPPADLKEESDDPRFYTQRASQLLAVGRVDDATADIEKAQNLDPKNSDAFALQSIIAVTQNEKGKALDLARKAVESDPNSATARIALSYAQQAQFDLPGALKSVEEAVKLDPGNALAWARLAELQQSFGQLDKSLESAKKAASLSPDLSRTQTVLGFAYLTQVKTKEARSAFDKAIELDQADPLPRLGLGLAKIRDGKLEEGRRELEIAITLDPDNGLIRSYLGKAYYEEKRDKLAKDQYDMAKTLDPLDPTPYFYDAIRKQTVNRPVEALHDLQKAIELNDNRAVYRSKLQLDSDLAARSSSLARIYNDMGFQQRALAEGWNSVNTDPTDFSAHRFLADSYSALPRHEVARVSELLVSQLLQPTNITPIQPQAAESNLFFISSQGPSAIGFNTYNPLFNRDQAIVQASGMVGENSTWSGEGIASGIYKNLSLSAGYSKFKTDGWRENDEQDDEIINVFAQYQLSYKSSIQAEYRYRDVTRGDLLQKFFPEDVFLGETNTIERHSARIGLRHEFSPNSIIISNFTYQEADFGFRDDQLFYLPDSGLTSIDILISEKAYGGEVQHLYRSNYFNLVSGVGHFDVNGTIDSTLETLFPSPFDIIRASISNDVKHTNVYMYSYIKPLSNLTLTVGASGDFTDGDNPAIADKDQFNPKLGITWSPVPNTTLRAAAFRVLRRTIPSEQTIEPTQVAGFNQFFDDFVGTKAWRYGGAIDQKFTKAIYGGLEFSERDIEVPGFDIFGDTISSDWDENLGRAYLFWTPHPWWALRAEYQYEKFERDKTKITDGMVDVDTNRVLLGGNFSHPSGLSASVIGTYNNQDGEFERIENGGGTFESGSDTFWLVDVAINYRLPKRYGFVTVGANNLFDEEFKYFEVDRRNPHIQPARMIYGKITLALP